MDFKSVPELVLIISSLAPGFIYYAILSKFLVGRAAQSREEYLLKLLVATGACWGLSLPIGYAMLSGEWGKDSPLKAAVLWVAIIVAIPVALALVAAYFSQWQVLKRIATRIGLNTVSSVPTGWDWIFGLQEPLFLLVTLKDGTALGGYLGPRSMASSTMGNRDLYLELSYKLKDDGSWEEVEDSAGFYISGSEISYIEFKRLMGNGDDQ